MGDDRRNEGSGAVVAIVLTLGIVVLLGILIVVGGAFFFVARTSDVQVMTTTAMPPPTASASAPADPIAEPGDLAPVELDGGGTSVVDHSNELEVNADGSITLSGIQLPIEDLKTKLAKMKEANESLQVKLKAGQSPEAVEASKDVQEFLKLHSIAYEIKQ
jgi:hypothetical protein